MIDFSPLDAAATIRSLNMWERLPAAIETNPSHVGFFMKSFANPTYEG